MLQVGSNVALTEHPAPGQPRPQHRAALRPRCSIPTHSCTCSSHPTQDTHSLRVFSFFNTKIPVLASPESADLHPQKLDELRPPCTSGSKTHELSFGFRNMGIFILVYCWGLEYEEKFGAVCKFLPDSQRVVCFHPQWQTGSKAVSTSQA